MSVVLELRRPVDAPIAVDDERLSPDVPAPTAWAPSGRVRAHGHRIPSRRRGSRCIASLGATRDDRRPRMSGRTRGARDRVRTRRCALPRLRQRVRDSRADVVGTLTPIRARRRRNRRRARRRTLRRVRCECAPRASRGSEHRAWTTGIHRAHRRPSRNPGTRGRRAGTGTLTHTKAGRARNSGQTLSDTTYSAPHISACDISTRSEAARARGRSASSRVTPRRRADLRAARTARCSRGSPRPRPTARAWRCSSPAQDRRNPRAECASVPAEAP